MEHSFEELSKMNVAQLREIADGLTHDAVKGHSTMHKEQLVVAICQALGIDAHSHHQVVGLDKAKVKLQIRNLKSKRVKAIEGKDGKELKRLRHAIKKLKHKIRRATV